MNASRRAVDARVLVLTHCCFPVPLVLLLQVTQHERCRIRLTILPDAGVVPSGEHKVGAVRRTTWRPACPVP